MDDEGGNFNELFAGGWGDIPSPIAEPLIGLHFDSLMNIQQQPDVVEDENFFPTLSEFLDQHLPPLPPTLQLPSTLVPPTTLPLVPLPSTLVPPTTLPLPPPPPPTLPPPLLPLLAQPPTLPPPSTLQLLPLPTKEIINLEKTEREEEINRKSVPTLSQRVADLEEYRNYKARRDHEDQNKTGTKRRSKEDHNMVEKRRRNLFAQKIKTLREFIPNSDKSCIATVLEDAATYGKSLQQQYRTIMHQNMLQAQYYYASYFPMRQMMDSSAYPTNVPMAPTSGLNLNPLGKSGFQPAAFQPQFPFHTTPAPYTYNQGMSAP